MYITKAQKDKLISDYKVQKAETDLYWKGYLQARADGSSETTVQKIHERWQEKRNIERGMRYAMSSLGLDTIGA